jgi:hypothetical protein
MPTQLCKLLLFREPFVYFPTISKFAIAPIKPHAEIQTSATITIVTRVDIQFDSSPSNFDVAS